MRKTIAILVILISLISCNKGGGGSDSKPAAVENPVDETAEVFELNPTLWAQDGQWVWPDTSDGTVEIYKFLPSGAYAYVKRIPHSTIYEQSTGTVRAKSATVLEFEDENTGETVQIDYSFEGPILKMCAGLQCYGFDWYQ